MASGFTTRAGPIQCGAMVDLVELTRRFRSVRGASEALCEPLSPEDCCAQSMPDASPAKWHLAHTSWFFETLILEKRNGYRPFDPTYRVLFNSYYNSLGEQYPRPHRGLLTRPSFDEVLAYRGHVDRHILESLENGLDADDLSVLELGIHHEQQHQELLLADIKHLLSQNPLHPVYLAESDGGERASGAAVADLGWCEIESGVERIGFAGKDFAFDNERPRHRVHVEAFALGNRLVTNGEILDFMADGGYTTPGLWLSDGWARVVSKGWRAPLYWEQRGGGWWTFTLSGMRRVRRDEPACHVSYYEANAYAAWAGARLPTETEWEILASAVPVEGNFQESGRLHPAPLSSTGPPAQLFGDVWEWTASAYAPYPGFRPLTGSLGEYNGKFMSSQMVLRGGSCATAASHIRCTYRNFFYPEDRWQWSGIRLARDA